MCEASAGPLVEVGGARVRLRQFLAIRKCRARLLDGRYLGINKFRNKKVPDGPNSPALDA